MTDVTITTRTRCPICTLGLLVAIGPELWQCERPTCNNEFFYDGEPGRQTLNARDKPNFVSPATRRRRVRGNLIRIALVLAAVGIMYLEGQHQRAPGVGFAFALILVFGVALSLGTRHGR